MKAKLIIYYISLILVSVTFTKIGIDRLLVGINLILMVLMLILAELTELNNKNHDKRRKN